MTLAIFPRWEVGGLTANVSLALGTHRNALLGLGDNIIYEGLDAHVLSGEGGSNVFVYLDIRDAPSSAAGYSMAYKMTDLWPKAIGPAQFLIHINGQINLQTELLVD